METKIPESMIYLLPKLSEDTLTRFNQCVEILEEQYNPDALEQRKTRLIIKMRLKELYGDMWKNVYNQTKHFPIQMREILLYMRLPDRFYTNRNYQNLLRVAVLLKRKYEDYLWYMENYFIKENRWKEIQNPYDVVNKIIETYST
jgi:hypothetical protein